jgi:exodeoxyribonuclease-3
MRFVIWNCGGAFHKKLDVLTQLAPDIAIVPEACESSRLPDSFASSGTRTYEWIGNLPYKGLGVIAFAPFELELACPPENNLEWVIPLRVRGPVNFNLIAVWAMNHRASAKARGPNRNGPIKGALNTYSHLFEEGPVVVAGDFNDSAIWDKPNGARPFGTNVELLKQLGLVSGYHQIRDESFGSESEPTIYWRDRTIDGPQYHIDYCFVPEGWIPNATVKIESFDKWVAPKHSDHVPLVIDFADPISPPA